MLKIYAAQQNADLQEGRGPMVPKGYFTQLSDAETFAKTLPGVMGVGHGEVIAIEVCEELADHPAWTKERLRESALAKLTVAERKALGL